MFPVVRHQTCPVTLAVFLLCLAIPARAQTSADLTLTSSYAARGMELDHRPALQLRIEHDADDGWYGGAFASPVALGGERQAQLTAYGGRARRLSSTLSWDAGITGTAYLGDARFNYHELYAGLAIDRASVRLFYSPAYYGEERSFYLDVNGGYPLTDQLSLALHGGLLQPAGEKRVIDLRLALSRDVGDFNVQAGWQVKGQGYLAGSSRARAVVLSVSRRF